jgi:ferredoxin
VTVVRVVVDRDKCIGSGNCVYWAPGSFELDDDGTSVPADPGSHPSAEVLEALQVAADGCPTRAITVEVAEDAPGGGDR